jgi:hypothetical protein
MRERCALSVRERCALSGAGSGAAGAARTRRADADAGGVDSDAFDVPGASGVRVLLVAGDGGASTTPVGTGLAPSGAAVTQPFGTAVAASAPPNEPEPGAPALTAIRLSLVAATIMTAAALLLSRRYRWRSPLVRR